MKRSLPPPPSSLPSFLVPSPLVRDFTVAGDSWPSVQGRRAWYGSARDGVDKTEMDRAQTFAEEFCSKIVSWPQISRVGFNNFPWPPCLSIPPPSPFLHVHLLGDLVHGHRAGCVRRRPLSAHKSPVNMPTTPWPLPVAGEEERRGAAQRKMSSWVARSRFDSSASLLR